MGKGTKTGGLTVASIVGQSLNRAMTGPLAILILIPVLVCGVGLTTALISWSSSRKTIERFAAKRFNDEAKLVHWQVEQSLQQGDAILAALRSFLSRRGTEFEYESFADELAQQFNRRPAIAFLGIGDKDGNYTGIYPRDSATDTRELILSVRRMQASGKAHMREYLIADDALKLIRDEPEFGYDPRTRPWYILAAREKERVTSDPYPWYDAGLIGVTVAEPWFTASSDMAAVVEVDFNLNTLSKQVELLEDLYGSRIMIHSRKGEIIALSGYRQAAGRDREGKGHVPRVDEISEPLLKRYFTQVAGQAAAQEDHVDLELDSERFLAISRSIELPGEAQWQVVCIGSLDSLLRAARDGMWKSVVVALVAMLLATAIAFFFARHIVATHVRANRAERDAMHARDEARALGAYRMRRLLGKGGMGEVWLGEHRLLARPVAIKLVHAQLTQSLDAATRKTFRTRFEREAKALARLQSPHTIQIFDFGISESGDLFYVMELLDGVDLHKLVRSFGAQPVERVRHILEEAADSLAEAHSHGLIHRDIKPANIFLCRQFDHYDLVKVLDFGMVRWTDPKQLRDDDGAVLTMQGALNGTPAYMSPEQASEEESEVGERADIYSLALVGWFLLTAKDLFGRDTQMQTILAQIQEEPPSLCEVTEADVPEAFEAFLRTCLAKKPEDRPASMREVAQRLRELREVTDPSGKAWTEEACQAWWQSIPAPDFFCDTPAEGQNLPSLHRQQSGGASSPAVDATMVAVAKTIVSSEKA